VQTVGSALLGVGVLLTVLAVGIDALQPWQRQAGWARDWWGALGWRFAPLAWLSVISGVALLAYVFRNPLQRVWERAFILRTTLLMRGYFAAGVALLVGKVVACLVILAVGLMFLLEYQLGGKDWGYPLRRERRRSLSRYTYRGGCHYACDCPKSPDERDYAEPPANPVCVVRYGDFRAAVDFALGGLSRCRARAAAATRWRARPTRESRASL
jgi:hypothetical protein